METRKLIQKIKAVHIPCYISDDDTETTPLCAESLTFHKFKRLNYQSFKLESSRLYGFDISPPSLQLADSLQSLSKFSDIIISNRALDKHNLTSELGEAVKQYLQQDTIDLSSTKRKVKCASMERVTSSDLCLFYRYKACKKQIKRMCDLNLWLLFEKIKNRFRAFSKDSVQTLLQDLTRLIVNFILSSDSDLHFDKCKYIIDRLEELENIIHDRFNLKNDTSKKGASFFPMSSLKSISSPREPPDSQPSSQTNLERGTPRAPLRSLQNNKPKSFTFNVLPSNKAPRDSPIDEIEEKVAYKQVLQLIAEVKYTMAQIGHLLHYDRLANPHIEQLYPKNFKKRWETRPIPPSPMHRSRDPSIQHDGTFSSALDEKLPSIDLDAEKMHSSRTDVNPSSEEAKDPSNLLRYFYWAQTFLDDFEEDVVERRKEGLGKYCVWKMKKWAKHHKQEKVVRKYQDFQMICRICARNIKLDNFKAHSKLCKTMAEYNQEAKNLETKIEDIISDMNMRCKELRAQLMAVENKYEPFKRRNNGAANRNSPEPFKPLWLKKFQKTMSTASGESVEDETQKVEEGPKSAREMEEENQSSSTDKRSKRGRKHDWNADNNVRRNMIEEAVRDIEGDNERHGLMLYRKIENNKEQEEIKSPEGEQDSWSEGPILSEDMKKESFIEELMDKYPSEYDFLSRQNSGNEGDFIIKKIPQLNQRMASETNLPSIQNFPSGYYVDRPKTEPASEGEETDSNKKVGDRDRTVPVESSRGIEKNSSESGTLKLSVDISSSDKSRGNSPIIETRKNIVYPKSRFSNFRSTMNTTDPREENDSSKQAAEKEENKPIEEEEQEEREVKTERIRKDRDRALIRRSTMIEGKVDEKDRKLFHELAELKKKKENKIHAYHMYDVMCRTKEEIMLNQEPFHKKMEIIREEASKEIRLCQEKIEDKVIKAYADNFLSVLIQRIQVGRNIQNTQRELDILEGKPIDENADRKLTQKRLFLLRGNSSLTLTKNRIGFASTPTTLQPSRMLDEQSSFKSPILSITKSNSSHPAQSIFAEYMKSNEEIKRNNSSTVTSVLQPPQRLDEVTSQDKLNEMVKSQVIENIKKYGENGQKSLIELQEDDDELLVAKQDNDDEIFGKICEANFEEREQPLLITKKGSQTKEQMQARLRGSIIASNRLLKESEKSDKKSSENGSSKDETQNSETKDVFRDSKGQISFRIDISPETQAESQEPEEAKSPDTPSFEAPPISRTVTAPVKTLSSTKKGLVSKAPRNRILTMINNNRKIEDRPKILSEHFLAEIPQCEPNSNPYISVNPNSKLLYQCEPSLIEKCMDDEVSPAKLLQREPNRPPPINRAYAEDHMKDPVEHHPKEEGSPLIPESPLIQKGYSSDSQVKKVHGTFARQPLIGRNDFEEIEVISKGAYGRVSLVKRKATNDLYAMKEINLMGKFTKNFQELENLRNENKILGLAKEDFVVRALFTFIHDTSICFVMEYMIGGDFGDILCTYGRLDEDVARFYIAEIVLAVEYLHKLGIAHRDLKPENILLDKHGHAKLTDFGLSKRGLSKKIFVDDELESPSIALKKEKEQTINKLWTNKSDLDNKINLKLKGKVMEKKGVIRGMPSQARDVGSAEEEKSEKLSGSKEELYNQQKLKRPIRLIGTPDYMAPEIILGHSIPDERIIDWWSLGVILAEFIFGIPPFNDETREKIHDNIINLRVLWEREKESEYMSPEASDLIWKLLVPDPTKRLGVNGADEIKRHPFFKSVDWEKLRHQQAPIIPEWENESDTRNFVRMKDKLKDNDNKENPFTQKDKNTSNRQVTKERLEAAKENFNIINYTALDSDNVRVAEETLKQKERELKQIVNDRPEGGERMGIYDDIFDMPN